MSGFNKIIVLGNLTRDPEMRTTQSGLAICRFTVANSRNVRSAESTREENAFIDVEAFGKQAELIGKHFHKGKQIFIEGRLRTNEWENQQGERRSKLVAILDSFEFMGRSEDRGYGQGSAEESHGQRFEEKARARRNHKVEEEEDIPF